MAGQNIAEHCECPDKDRDIFCSGYKQFSKIIQSAGRFRPRMAETLKLSLTLSRRSRKKIDFPDIPFYFQVTLYM